MHAHAETLQQLQRGIRKAFGERRQDAIGGFDEIDLDILLRIDPVEAIRDELARRVVQLRRQLRAGGTCPDDCDLELLGPQGL